MPLSEHRLSAIVDVYLNSLAEEPFEDISIAVGNRQSDAAYFLQRVQWRVQKLESIWLRFSATELHAPQVEVASSIWFRSPASTAEADRGRRALFIAFEQLLVDRGHHARSFGGFASFLCHSPAGKGVIALLKAERRQRIVKAHGALPSSIGGRFPSC